MTIRVSLLEDHLKGDQEEEKEGTYCRDICCTKSLLLYDRPIRRAWSRVTGVVRLSGGPIGDTMPTGGLGGQPTSAFCSYDTLIPNFSHLDVACIRRMGSVRR